MNDYQSLSHVFMPKYRRKVLYGPLRKHLGEVFRELARHRERLLEEGHLQPDQVHKLLSIPPKDAVAQVGGSEGEECDSHCADVWGPGAELCR